MPKVDKYQYVRPTKRRIEIFILLFALSLVSAMLSGQYCFFCLSMAISFSLAVPFFYLFACMIDWMYEQIKKQTKQKFK